MLDKYLIPGTQVLININDISNGEQAEKYERLCATGRIIELKENPIKGNFDFKHLQKIHEYIFQDVYEWAGKFRTVGLIKGATEFCRPEYLDGQQKEIFTALKKDNYFQMLDKENFSIKAAALLGNLNMLHPFREGNGRTQREFMRELALNAGYDLNLENKMYEDKNFKEKMVAASIKSAFIDDLDLQQIIKESITPIYHMEIPDVISQAPAIEELSKKPNTRDLYRKRSRKPTVSIVG